MIKALNGALSGAERAVKLFSELGVTSFRPLQKFKNVTVDYVKIGEFNGQPMWKKVVQRNDGTKIIGSFTGTSCTGVKETNAIGTISTSFGAQNYDKVTQIMMSDGRYLNRLGHKNNSSRFIDFYEDSFLNQSYNAHNDSGEMYNKLIAEIRGQKPKSKYAGIIDELKKEWSKHTPATNEKESDSFLEFCKRWAK